MCKEINLAVLKTFKWLYVIGETITFDAGNGYFANRKSLVSSDFTLVFSRIRNGGDYNFVVEKQTADDLIITLPPLSKVSGNTDATITLTGDSGLLFWLSFTFDGEYNLFTLNGVGSGSGDEAISSGLIVEEVVTSRPLTILDNGKHLNCNSEAPMTITILPGMPQTPLAFNCVICQKGNGKVTIVGLGGVILNEPDLQFSTAKKFATVGVLNYGTNIGDETYVLTGYTSI